MKVLVTGAAGFIGSTLAHRLLDRGDEVVGIDNLNAYYDVRLKQARLERLLERAGFLFQKLDIIERKPMAEPFAAGKIGAVVHLAGRPIPVFNRGEMVRDFTYVDDIVEGVIRVMGKPAAPAVGWSGDRPDPATSYAPWRIFNIGNNQPVKLMRYIEVLELCLGRKAQLDLLPMQAGDVPATFADVGELQKSVGYKPQTPIEIGVRRFAEWYQAFYKKSA